MSLLGKIGHAVGDIVHDVEKLGEGGLHFLEGAGKAVLGTAEDIAKGAFGVVKAAVGLIAFRPLRAKEVALAQRVFGSSIQLDRVLICSLSGFGGRPFTVPGAEVALIATYIPGIGGLVFVAALLAHATDKYIIFAGRDAYKDGINWDSKKTPGARLIHELTHVWQGNYHIFAPTYVFNSLANQCSCCVQNQSTSRAYGYSPGRNWGDYTAEQQAAIVEGWYVNAIGKTGAARDFAREPYITCNIRPGKPSATTKFPSEGQKLLMQGHPQNQLPKDLHINPGTDLRISGLTPGILATKPGTVTAAPTIRTSAAGVVGRLRP